jgi:hypothetical protein
MGVAISLKICLRIALIGGKIKSCLAGQTAGGNEPHQRTKGKSGFLSDCPF